MYEFGGAYNIQPTTVTLKLCGTEMLPYMTLT